MTFEIARFARRKLDPSSLHNILNGARVRRFVFSLLLTLIISASVAGTSELASSRSFLIDPTEAIDVSSIAISSGHRVVIAGSVDSSGSAWAAKTDLDGRTVWRINVPSESTQIPKDPSTFSDSTISGDDVTVLCGHIGAQPPTSPQNYLLFIKENGEKLSDKRFSPRDSDLLLSSISKCVAWEGGILTVGHAFKRGPYGPESPSGAYYWIAFLDASHNIIWEREIPRTIGFEVVNALRIIKDGSVVFSVTDNRRSQAIKIGKDGAIIAGEILEGAYALVKTGNATAPVQLLPLMPDMNWEVVTLDDRLKVASRTLSKLKVNMVVRSAWSIGDPGFVVFGESVRNGALRWAAIRGVSKDMGAIKDINAQFLSQTFTINAVNYNNIIGKFVLAYTVREPSKTKSAKRTYVEQFAY